MMHNCITYLSKYVQAFDAFSTDRFIFCRKTQGDAWFKPTEENVSAGVCLRVEPGHFRVFPYENAYLAPFEAAVRLLNPVVAVKVRSAAVHAALTIVYVIFVFFKNFISLTFRMP
jgi:hypothetical protein